MEYKNILSSNQISLKTFYIENPMIAMINNAKGEIYINGKSIDVTTNLTLIVPKYSQVSCDLVSQFTHQSIELHTLILGETELQSVFSLLKPLIKSGAPITRHLPDYHLLTPEIVKTNFSLLKQCLPLAHGTPSQETMFMQQCLFFILMTVYHEGVDILNIFRFNYDEPKNQAITHLITQDPQRKWHLDDVAKTLFTTPSTLRRHLNKEGVSFCQLLLDVRMGIALNYLTFSNYSVFQISHRCGFGSNAYFCDAFKRKYSMTPSQFRTQSRQLNHLSTIPNMSLKKD